LDFRRCLCISSLLGIFAAQANATTVTPSHLRCENLLDPLGIEVVKPRLSWILDSDRSNERQTGYEVVVDGYWDSGRVESDQSINVEYEGKELAPATRYSWRVRVWDAQGKPSDWSKTATFSTALKQWSAKWIGHDEPENKQDARRLPARYLRREFPITKKVTRATSYVCGLGFFDLSLNGEKVSQDVMDPALSDYAKTAYFVTFDVTDRLRHGVNTIGVVLGNGRFYAPRRETPQVPPALTGTYGYPKLLLQLEVEYDDGSKSTVISDEHWRLTTEGPIRANNEYDGEEYDARMEMPGWDRAGFNDSKWENASVVAAPGGTLKAQMIEPMKITQIIHPVGITEPLPGTYVVDMGQSLSLIHI